MLLLLIFLFTLGRNTTIQSTNSKDFLPNYSPCHLSNVGVICNQVSLKEVKRVFSLTSFHGLPSVKLVLKPYISTETFIPEDILGNKRVLEIWIEYPQGTVQNKSTSLQVDPNAFRATKNYTRTFTLNNFDCVLLDLSFLSGFDKLNTLTFGNLGNIHFCLPSLPTLSGLVKLGIDYCLGLNELYSFPLIKTGLKGFSFIGITEECDCFLRYTDETVDRVLEWVFISSGNTLEELKIADMAEMTKVPHRISSFKSLTKLKMYNNNISTIKTGDLSFNAPVLLLDITKNNITQIEPGALRGM